MFKGKLILGLALVALFSALLLLSNGTPRALAQEIPQSDAQGIPFAPDAPLPLDHFWCYQTTGQPVNEVVDTQDQFNVGGLVPIQVGAPIRFCNPVKKTHSGKVFKIKDPDAHLILYETGVAADLLVKVDVKNQFGNPQRLKVFGPAIRLAVPTQKEGHEFPQDLDHFKCYKVKGGPIDSVVGLKDQFQQVQAVNVGRAVLLCNPTRKIHNAQPFEVKHPEAHLVCYKVTPVQFTIIRGTQNQFRQEQLQVQNPDLLCAPSRKQIVPNP